MKAQKAIAIIMVLTSSALTAWVSGDIAYPAILCMLGLMGLQRRFTWAIRPERRIIRLLLLLFLAMMFALQFRYASSTGRVANQEAAAFAWQTIARYFLASMILILFLGSPERLPSSLGLFHVAITICAGQVLLLDNMAIVFRLSELFCVILVVLYAAAGHGSMDTPAAPRAARTSSPSCFRKKAGVFAFGLILLVAANCGWIASTILYRHVGVLNYLPVWFWRGNVALDSATDGLARAGFSDSGRLSSVLLIKGDQDPTPALSITCDSRPGYLRARAFDVYRQSQWYEAPHREALFPEKNMPFGISFVGRRNLFRLYEADATDSERMTVRHESEFTDAVFTPLGTSSLEAPLSFLQRDDNDIVYPPNSWSGLSYRVAYAKSAYQKPPTYVQRRRMLDVPRDLDPRIHQLTSAIFAGCNTTGEKIHAVVSYFRTNYIYSLELDIAPDRDKLIHFLLEESSGYCEYFASGAAILLRLAGVPTRYITGFSVTEQDAQSGLWVARNMDAHAWAEAWDQERNLWTIVEATVGQELVGVSDAERLAAMGGGTGALLGPLLQALYQYGLAGAIAWVFKSYGLLAGLLLLTILLGGALWLALSRHYKRKNSNGRTQSRAARNPALVSLHKMLARMDRKVRAAGPRRDLGETLHAFSQRLQARDTGDGLWTRISDWYLEYASLRYCRQISYRRLQRLQQLAQGLRDSL